MDTEINIREKALETLKKIIANGGPTESDYQDLEFSLGTLAMDGQQSSLVTQQFAPVISSCDFLFDKCSLMGHIRTKPYGYAGDFEIIERIYQKRILKEDYRRWDTYSLKHPAAQAVRNRKKYFKTLLRNKLTQNPSMTLLNIASGPARDLLEVYQDLQYKERLETTCIEMDANAIAYATAVTAPFTAHITFIHKNVFRFQATTTYDLVWSAGLFDYFDDKAFILLLKKFGTWVKPGGEIVVGNFNDDHNPSRLFMELFGEWHLNHRTEQNLINLALEAGFHHNQITVGRESEQINLFLHIKI